MPNGSGSGEQLFVPESGHARESAPEVADHNYAAHAVSLQRA